MATPIGQPGRPYVFNLTIKDKNGDPQDLTVFEGYALVAYTDMQKVIAQWSKNVLDGYLSLTETDAPTGKVQLFLPASKTTGIDNVMVYIEPVMQIVDGTYGKMQLGTKDGAKYELIKITSAGKVKVPDLHP